MNSTVQIVKIDGPIPELEYDGTEGYVVEWNGECMGRAATFDSAVDVARVEVGREIPFDDRGLEGQFLPDDAADYFGRQTWTAR
jgi:hypothetical protein